MVRIIIDDVEEIFDTEVVRAGNGAVAHAKKKHIGKKAKLVVTK